MAKRSTKTELIQREEIAVETLCAHAGERPYRLEGILADRLGVSRRQAARYVSRAREALRRSAGERLGDLAASLPDAIREAMDAAKAVGDLRAVVRLLELVHAVSPIPVNAPVGPSRIEFRIVESDGTVRSTGRAEDDREVIGDEREQVRVHHPGV